MNLAARLCDLAQGGEVLADPALVAALPPLARAGAPRQVLVRGVSAPVDVVDLALHPLTDGATADPVCGIHLTDETAVSWRSAGSLGRWLFCSDSCVDTWESRPGPGEEGPADEAFVRDSIA